MQGSGPPQPQPPCAGRRTARPAGRRPWSPSRPRGMTAQWRTSSAAACGPESDGRRGRPLQPWSGAHTRTLISRGLTATFGRLMALDASPKLVQKGGSPSRARAGVRPCRALPPALLRFFEHWIPEASRIQKASNIAKNGAIAPFQHFEHHVVPCRSLRLLFYRPSLTAASGAQAHGAQVHCRARLGRLRHPCARAAHVDPPGSSQI